MAASRLLNFLLLLSDEFTTTHGANCSERNPENSWLTPTHQMNEKIPSSRQVGKVEILSHHKPHYHQNAI